MPERLPNDKASTRSPAQEATALDVARRLTGIAASPGLGIGPAFVLRPPDLRFEPQESGADAAEQQQRFDEALQKSRADLQAVREQTAQKLGEEHAEIFDAHLLMLDDPELLDQVAAGLQGGQSAETALGAVSDTFIAVFETMEDEYMRERAADLRDVRNRVLSHLLGRPLTSLGDLREPAVLVAHDLTPSDTAALNRELVKGIVTAVGGRTSHSAIMARGLGLPAVVGVGEAAMTLESGISLIVDGELGRVLVEPGESALTEAQSRAQAYAERQGRLLALVGTEGRTKDGTRIELAANIGSPADLPIALEYGAEGVGLYRTEFLYMAQDRLPTEEEQYLAYRAVLEGMHGKPVIIRTLDIGGDKAAPYLDLPEEENPFLGFRAIRLCLARSEIFRVQLRALLRASVHGDLKIMFPLVSTLEELRQAKALLEEERQKLLAEGAEVAQNIPVGIMIEVPAAAVLAGTLAREADFFSVGSNDLIGYSMAADRMNEQVSGLYQPLNPSVLKMIQLTCEGAAHHGRWVGVCGEMAGDRLAMPLLVGLGVTELSMSAPALLSRREQLLNLDLAQAQRVAAEALTLGTAAEVEALVHREFGDAVAQPFTDSQGGE
ncbi:phosphoenolpyruvate--protein phosphotransferase [Deinococcus radiophilus]|uniref:Phosphoenolpyruvate-protein phosphotransferase n=1 Tax=Deinococcus radiophilus TaxID=32062 RepID=A0A3S0JP91_9DEIO|nr:phosphoenolpyruvate--protein phosphotransferase [Deinococcus radiophilus]RTR26131.1 phosphoenolpyruvate--protein phosphotransferase [Deinococcus radiophilus]